MHPEIISLCLFMFVTSCSPGPNNIVASYSGFNFGILKTIPHMWGVVFGFTMVDVNDHVPFGIQKILYFDHVTVTQYCLFLFVPPS